MQTPENGSTHFPHSLLLEIMPFDYAKWAGLFTGENQHDGVVGQFGSDRDGERCELGGEDQRTKKKKKKKKRRGKKKRLDSKSEEENGEERCCFTDDDKKKKEESGRGGVRVLGSSRLLSACTRLHQRVVQRRGRSSNSLRSSNIYKLEMEQKRLEENAFVYNWLQQQLKLSPAYKKMLEVCTCMESKGKSGGLADTEFTDISFEELLAQEKFTLLRPLMLHPKINLQAELAFWVLELWDHQWHRIS
ncbi:hypothetical protein V6N11_048753 [Hibiscus sabdariffa]|uniref:Uncharacterized protein n=1 Tax=Hibiscus sabdariffa TaxID=183260 RepID=A0ABR2PW74_9ROSI